MSKIKDVTYYQPVNPATAFQVLFGLTYDIRAAQINNNVSQIGLKHKQDELDNFINSLVVDDDQKLKVQ